MKTFCVTLLVLLSACTERGCLIDSVCAFPMHPEQADWRRVKQICDAHPDQCHTAVSVMTGD
jgi:hypothetical protein